MINVVLVPTPLVPWVWAGAKVWLEPAINPASGRHTIETLEAQCLAGAQSLWVAIDGADMVGAATTQVVDYPAGRWLVVGFLGAMNLKEYIQAGLVQFEAWARANGCLGLLITGRKGWGRMLNLNPVHVTFEKRITQDG